MYRPGTVNRTGIRDCRTPLKIPEAVNFELSEAEAQFVKGRIKENCLGTLLARLASRPKAGMADYFCEEPEVVGFV